MADRVSNKRREIRRQRAVDKGGVVKNVIRMIFDGRISSDPDLPILFWHRKRNKKAANR